METKVNYTLVGAFVIVLLTATILAIIWLSSGFSFDQYTYYKIYMKESISGLSIDGPVEYNGVNVGTVKSIEINHKDPQVVELLVRVKESAPITQGTAATLATRGLTGLVYIALKDNSSDLRPLVALPGQDYPVIKTAPSIFVRLDLALSQVSTSLQGVTESIRSVLNPENQKSIRETLEHLNRFTKTLDDNTKKLDSILTNTSQFTLQLTPLIKSSQRMINMIELQAMPVTYRALQNLENITRTLNDVANSLKQNPSILIRGQSPTLGPGERR